MSVLYQAAFEFANAGVTLSGLGLVILAARTRGLQRVHAWVKAVFFRIDHAGQKGCKRLSLGHARNVDTFPVPDGCP
jgi:hypothetical protein